MGSIDESVRRVPDERMVKEVVENIRKRVAEMDVIKTRIEARVNVKREYEYYSGKVSIAYIYIYIYNQFIIYKFGLHILHRSEN